MQGQAFSREWVAAVFLGFHEGQAGAGIAHKVAGVRGQFADEYMDTLFVVQYERRGTQVGSTFSVGSGKQYASETVPEAARFLL